MVRAFVNIGARRTRDKGFICCGEVRGGGRVASDDDESESEESLRLAWLDAEEFETFFKCSLSGFLRRVQYCNFFNVTS